MSQPEPENSSREIANDEIDLVDLFLIVWKRKWMIVALTVFLTVAAAGGSMLMPKTYEISAIMEPGSNAEGIPVETPQTIRENIIGGAYDQLVAVKLGLSLDKVPKYKVLVPKQTNLVKIVIESTDPQQAVLILQELLACVSESVQKGLDLEVGLVKNEIKKSQLEASFLFESIKLLKEQTAQIDLKMTELEKERKAALAAPKGDAMAVLLYSNEIQNQQIYLNDLQEKLANTLKKNNQIALAIENIQLKLVSIQGTNINKQPSIPEKPIKPKKTLIVALGFMLGLMGGIMLAFFAEFMAKVRREQKAVE